MSISATRTRSAEMRCSSSWSWLVCGATSKLDSLRVIEETGLTPASYATVTRRLPHYAKPSFRKALAAAFAARADFGPAALILYDMSTLYFEAYEGDGFREPGHSKERWIDPQITIGLLTTPPGSR